MTEDPLEAYFTKDRLKRLRDFHYRYPLWCGDWPEHAATTAEATLVSRTARLKTALREAKTECDKKPWNQTSWVMPKPQDLVISQADPQIDIPRKPRLISRDTVAYWDDLPAVFSALLAAVNYCLAPWKQELYGPAIYLPERLEVQPPPHKELWPQNIQAILETTDPMFLGIEEHRFKSSGEQLLYLYHEATEPGISPRDRKRKLANLRARWEAIGHEAGIIPSFRGGKKHSIPMEQLDRLSAEAEQMLKEVREYAPTEAEKGSVRTLLATEPHIPERNKWMILNERSRSLKSASALVRQAQGPQLKKEQREWDRRVQLDLWCLRLAFPALTKTEIISAQPKAKRGHMWLLEKRLGVGSKLATQQLSRHRKAQSST